MRLAAVFSSVVALVFLSAQGDLPSPPFYINRDARFAIIFPGPPVAKDVTYAARGAAPVPARQFSFDEGTTRHSVTVAPFPAGPAVDLGLVERAADDLRRRGVVRFQAAEDYEPGLPGRQLSITESNGRVLRASVHMWDHRLYITEASGASGAPSALRFEQSLTLLNADGSQVNIGRPPER